MTGTPTTHTPGAHVHEVSLPAFEPPGAGVYRPEADPMRDQASFRQVCAAITRRAYRSAGAGFSARF